MEDTDKELIILSESIDKKKQEISYANKELEELEHKRWITLQERNKHNALIEIGNFINIYGNILDKTLHNQLRLKLVDIMYKDLHEPYSFDLVLRLMLDKIGVSYQYLNKDKKKPIQLQIIY